MTAPKDVPNPARDPSSLNTMADNRPTAQPTSPQNSLTLLLLGLIVVLLFVLTYYWSQAGERLLQSFMGAGFSPDSDLHQWIHFVFTMTFTGIACSLPVLFWRHYKKRAVCAEKLATQHDPRLSEALKILQEAFAYFDANDTLVMCNDEFRRLHPAPDQIIQPGRSYAEIVRAGVGTGKVIEALGREEEHIEQRMHLHKDVSSPIIRELKNGKSYIVNEGRMPDGGTCVTMIDISNLQQRTKIIELSEIVSVAANESQSPKEAVYMCLKVVCEHFDWALGNALIVPDDDPNSLVSSGIWHHKGDDRYADLREITDNLRFTSEMDSVCIRALKTRKPAWFVATPISIDHPRAEICHRLGLKLSFGFPVFIGKDVVAVLQFFAHEREIISVDAQSIQFMGHIVKQLGMVYERERAKEKLTAAYQSLEKRVDQRTEELRNQIAKKERTERKLRESEETLNEAQKIAHLGSWMWDIGSGREEWSDEQFRIFGLVPGSIVPTYDTFLAALHPKDKDGVVQAVADTLEGVEPYDLEFRIIRPDGNVRYIHAEGKVYRSADGEPEKMIGIALDITDRKKTEQALAESVEQVRSMFTYSDGVIVLVALDGSILQANPALQKMLGYTYEELKRLSVLDITHPGDRAYTVEKRTSLINGEIKSFYLEKRYVSKDGNTVWIRGSANLIRDAEGKPHYLLGQFQDITERKKAEDALAESEARLRAIMDHSPAAILLKNIDGRYIVFNRSFEQRSGLSIDEAWEKTVYDVYPEALADIHAAHDRAVLESGQAVEREVPARWSDGTIHTHLSVKFPVFGTDGSVAAIGGINTDITERKRAEEELKDNERKLKDIIDTVPAIVAIKDRESRYIMTNRFHTEYFGGGEEKVIGKTSADVVTPEHGAEMRRREKKVIETGESSPYFDYELTDRQGMKRDLMIAKSPLKDISGQIIGTVTAAIDITERKQAEKALRNSQERLATITDNIPGCVYRRILRADGTISYPFISEGFSRIHGVDRERVMVDSIYLFNSLHPDDRANALEAIMVSAENLENYDGEYRFIGETGDTTWFRSIAKPRRGENGEVIWDGLTVDITERKQSENALRESELRLKTIMDNAGVEITLKDADQRFIIVNKAFEENHDVAEADVVGKTLREIWDNDDVEPFEALERKVLETGTAAQAELRAIDTPGIDTFLSVKFPIRNADGEVDSMGTINTDISEIKRAEEAMRKSEELFRRAFNDSGAGMVITELEGRIIRANTIMCETLGYTEDELNTLTFSDITHPDDVAEVIRQDTSLIDRKNDHCRFERRFIHKNGSIIWSETSADIIQNADGSPNSILGQHLFITERKRVEAERDRANRSNQLVKRIAVAANEAASINDAVRICLNEICAYMGWPVGHAFEVTEDGKFNSLRIWQLSEKGTFDEFRKVTESQQWEDGTLCGSVSKTKQPCWIKDLSKVTSFKRGKLLQDLPVKAAFAFPVLVGKDVVAALEFFSEKSEDPDPQLLELMGQVGTQIGRVFEREKALKDLDKFKTTLDRTQDCVFMFHPETLKFFYVNQGAVDQVGYSHEELMDMTPIDIKPEFTESSFRKMTNRLKKGKRRAHTFETVHKHKDGALVPVEIVLQYVSLGAQFSRFVAIVRDITDRKRAEEEIILRHNELLTLHEISEISLKAQTLKEAYQRIVDLISTNTNFPEVSIELYDRELENRGAGNVEQNASIRNDAEVDIGKNSIYSGFIVRTGNPFIDRTQKISTKKPDFISEKPAETTVSAPMVLGIKVIGALTLIHPKKITLDSRLPEWITILANHIAALTDRIRIEESIKNRDTLYMELSKRLEKIGPGGLHDHELMELVLLLTSRQVNVEDITTLIMKKLGGFSEALNSEASALVEVYGGKETAIAFSVIREAATRFAKEGISDRPILEDYDKLVTYCRSTMAHDQFEQLRVLYLNRKNKLITDEISHKGTVDKIAVYPREIVKRALELGASAVVFVHNHPSDDSMPSHTDIQMTKQLVTALELLEIVVHDHIIVTKSGYSSFKEMGML